MQRPAIQPVVSQCDDDGRDLAAARAGDHEAFGRLYDRHAAVVLSLCRRTSVSVSDADDALQETFIRAHAMLNQFDLATEAERFRRWLYAIARRVCAERRRAALRRLHHEGSAMTQAAILNHTHSDLVANGVVERTEDVDRLTAAMDQLDDTERLAIHLHYLEADPVRAAGPALGVSRSGYYKLLVRAREKLAALMTRSSSDHSKRKINKGQFDHEPFRIRTAGEHP